MTATYFTDNILTVVLDRLQVTQFSKLAASISSLPQLHTRWKIVALSCHSLGCVMVGNVKIHVHFLALNHAPSVLANVSKENYHALSCWVECFAIFSSAPLETVPVVKAPLAQSYILYGCGIRFCYLHGWTACSKASHCRLANSTLNHMHLFLCDILRNRTEQRCKNKCKRENLCQVGYFKYLLWNSCFPWKQWGNWSLWFAHRAAWL